MNTQKELLKNAFNEYLKVEGLAQGTNLVPVDVIMEAFTKFAPEVPVTKSQLGRLLSKRFLKRQTHYHSSTKLVQCYYINKKV